MDNFFKGLQVIELASVLAGPSVGMFFAELGARVIKVENKKAGGDVTRNWRLPEEPKEGISAYFSSVNYLKEYKSMDLTNPDSHSALLKLIAGSDIVISNYTARTASKLNLTAHILRKQNPHLIFLQLDGFESSDRPAYDVVLQAETGWISMTGTHIDEPAKLPVALIDVIAGHQLKEAALLGIIHKMRTGKGVTVHCNLERVALSALANQATNYLMQGHVAAPIGTNHPNIAPYGDWFETADDSRLVLAIGSDSHFTGLCKILGIEDICNDKKFNSNHVRVQNRIALREILYKTIKKLPFEEMAMKCTSENIPFGEIKKLDQVLESPPAQDMIRTEMIEGKSTSRLSGNAFKIEFF